MEVNDSIELVKKVFADIESGKKKNEILLKNGLEQFDNIKYPEIKFTISKEEIEKLREESLITEENKIDFSKYSPNGTIAKIVYSIFWKNGDIGKECHIVEGILNKYQENPNGVIVFYNFGKYLENHTNSIIDQHTIRAFLVYTAVQIKPEPDFEQIQKFLSKDGLKKDDNTGVYCYKEWVNSITQKTSLSNKDIDEILFSLGKKIKLKGGSKS